MTSWCYTTHVQVLYHSRSGVIPLTLSCYIRTLYKGHAGYNGGSSANTGKIFGSVRVKPFIGAGTTCSNVPGKLMSMTSHTKSNFLVKFIGAETALELSITVKTLIYSAS